MLQRRVRRVSAYTHLALHLAWAPAGGGIALTELGGELQTFGVKRSKVPAARLFVYAFAWSHDGATTVTLTDNGNPALVFDGRQVGRITSSALSGGMSVPAWSPDDRFAAFVGCHTRTGGTLTTALCK